MEIGSYKLGTYSLLKQILESFESEFKKNFIKIEHMWLLIVNMLLHCKFIPLNMISFHLKKVAT